MTDVLSRETRMLSGNFDADLELFREIFRRDATFRVREFRAGMGNRCALLYLDGMVNTQLMNLSIVRPVMLAEPASGDPAERLSEHILFSNDVKSTGQVQDHLRGILYETFRRKRLCRMLYIIMTMTTNIPMTITTTMIICTIIRMSMITPMRRAITTITAPTDMSTRIRRPSSTGWRGRSDIWKR